MKFRFVFRATRLDGSVAHLAVIRPGDSDEALAKAWQVAWRHFHAAMVAGEPLRKLELGPVIGEVGE